MKDVGWKAPQIAGERGAPVCSILANLPVSVNAQGTGDETFYGYRHAPDMRPGNDHCP
jgi:hypothetical protein